MTRYRTLLIVLFALIANFDSVPVLANNRVEFQRLGENRFVVEAMGQNFFGDPIKATRRAYVQACSICMAAGYTHLAIAQRSDERSNIVTMEFTVHNEAAAAGQPERMVCSELAEERFVEFAKKRLAKMAAKRK